MSDPLPDSAARDAAAALLPLVEASKRDPADVPAQHAMWRAFYDLPNWIFIMRGTVEEPRPYVAQNDSGSAILIFTHGEVMRSTALQLGLSEEEATRGLIIPTDHAPEWAAGFTKFGVQWAVFDGGLIQVPLGNLAFIRAEIGR